MNPMDLVKTKRIVRHRRVKRTLSQNGIVELMNQTLLERIRCILLNAGLSKDLWVEVMQFAILRINLLQHPYCVKLQELVPKNA